MSWEHILVGFAALVMVGGGVAFTIAVAYALFFKGRPRTAAAAAESATATAPPAATRHSAPPPPAQSQVTDLSDVSTAAWAKFMADTKSTMIDMGVERLRSDFREALGPKGKGGDAARPPTAPPA